MPFFLPLVHAGARVTGLAGVAQTVFERGGSLLFPDTPASQSDDACAGLEAALCYNKRPPGKRVNFKLMGVVSPFRIDWPALTSPAQVVVLRNAQGLATLTRLLCAGTWKYYIKRG